MKTNRIYIVLTALLTVFVASCGSSNQQQTETTNTADETADNSIWHNPVFSLFDTDGQGSYQLFRNKEKIATFSFEDGRKPLEMCSHNDDCFILVSATPQKDTTDSIKHSAEIFKNGRRVMELDDRLEALQFDMDEGHFYVLGKYDDSEYTVYRDGLRTLTFPAKTNSRPTDLCVFGQTIYVVMQRGNSSDLYKDNNKMYSIDGHCIDLQVSFRGIYMLMEDTLYLDRNVIMYNEYYRYSDKEMYSFPSMIATNDKDVLVGAHASFDKQHTYASFFLNMQTYATIQPDDKHIGDSELSTVCCGVALSNETCYYTTTILTADKEIMKPITYNYYTDHNESFSLQFENENARLLMMSSN
ncbi:MAG: hypothetical protein J6U21_11650 [Bacteroidales bacterium]|nr:hypothetical protein [Bacteroidales bacterium]